MVKAKRLTGLNPLAYMGVEPSSPSQFTVQRRAPTTHDYADWNIGAVWLIQNTTSVYMLINKLNGLARWVKFGAVDESVETLTGDTGGPVPGDTNNNINLISGFSPLSFNGDPGTHTLTLNSDGTLATNYPTDSGTAIPAAGVLNIVGGTGVETSGAGNTVTISAKDSVATQYDADVGSAIPMGNILNIFGGIGIATSGAGDSITISPSGDIATSFPTDAGTATPAAGILNILGGFTANTSGAGDTVTFNVNNLGGPGVVVTDVMGDYSVINGTDGQVIIAATGADPLWANITSIDGSVIITNGANSIDLEVVTSGSISAGENINISGVNVINLNETIHWPHTNSAGTTGMIYLGGSGGVGGSRFLHDYTNSGIVGPEYNVFLGINAGNLTMIEDGNVGIGENALSSLSGALGSANTAVGTDAMQSATNTRGTVAVGYQALQSATTSEGNCVVGYQAGMKITGVGQYNSLFGYRAGFNITTGSYNLCIGAGAGLNYTGSESQNICIQNSGVGGESNTLRIGNGEHVNCFIYGIYGVSVSGGIAVYINSQNQLGTTTSSIKYKENIHDIDAYSERIYDLKPVSFTYKSDVTKEIQYGLIAEEVQEVLPEIVVKVDGRPDAVQYHNLIPMLLNEVHKLKNRLKNLKGK